MKNIILAILNALLTVYWLAESIFVAIGIDKMPIASQVCACLITALIFFKLAIQYFTDI